MSGAKSESTADFARQQLIEDLRPFLDGLKRRLMATLPVDSMAQILDATERLVRSGIAERAVPEGERAPRFSLTDGDGRTVSLDQLLERGPAVVTFFRGFW